MLRRLKPNTPDLDKSLVSRPSHLHGDRARFLVFEEREHVVPLQLASDHNLLCAIHSLDLED